MAKETYATIYFDKDMTTEKSFGFDSFNENLLGNVLSISIGYDTGEMTDIPDFSEFKNSFSVLLGSFHVSEFKNLAFSKIDIFDRENNKIPYFGSYTRIDDININYYGPDNVYSVNMSLV